ncbi:MAG: EAL domain-containing protein [Gammaproteobacteria bacterium]|nr:EAL domain-containing protein [Gammaproteobacteria bacterium]
MTPKETNKIHTIAIPFALSVLIISAAALFAVISHEKNNFYQTQVELARSSIQGIQYNLNQFVENRQNIVQSFINHDPQFLLSLAQNPTDTKQLQIFKAKLKNRFRNGYAFSIADSDGHPIIESVKPSPGKRCKDDLKNYAQSSQNHVNTIIVHGNKPGTYHIDIMAKISNNKLSPILFVSFKIEPIVRLLKNSQAPGQKLFLVYKDHPEKIEISDSGIEPTYLLEKTLSKEVLKSTLYQQEIANTGWLSLAIPEKDLFSDFNKQLIKRALTLYFLLCIIIGFFVWRLLKEEKVRKIAEDNLNLSYKLLTAEVKYQTQELTDSKKYLEKLFMSAPYGIIVTNKEGIISSVNKQAETIFSYEPDELLNQSIDILSPQHHQDSHGHHINSFINSQKSKKISVNKELIGLKKNKQQFPVTIALSVLEYEKETKIIVSINDITELVSIQNQLMEEHERAVVTLASIGDGVITTDVDGKIKSINPTAERLTGWNSDDAINKPITTVYNNINETTREAIDNPINRSTKSKQELKSNSNVLIHKKGFDTPIEDSVSAIHNKDGTFIGVVLVFHDVTQSRQYAHEIEFQASHDELTGLFNRRKFDTHLSKLILESRKSNTEYALLYMDLDRFKSVNDTAGHAAGDELLKQLTRAISKDLRQRDLFARLGGDEFGIILDHCSLENSYIIAEKILKSVNEFNFHWKDEVFNVGISIGINAFKNTEDSADKVLSEADAACYTAKEGGRNRIQIYDEQAAKKLNESHIINLLTAAFENNQMRLYQQKILSANAQHKQDHYEILIRMLDNDKIIPPGMFLPSAEQCGLAINLDRWVIHSVFEWLSNHKNDLASLPVMSINLSGQSVTDKLFRVFIQEQFSIFDIEPSNICFEITETAAMHNLDIAKEFIHDLKALGCQFSLDDFGSGHASYSQLKHLSVDYLKIDGSLVKDILDDAIDFSIVKSINDVGHILNMKTIAEFVENQGIADKLSNIKVDYLQGYGIAKPAPLDELLEKNS